MADCTLPSPAVESACSTCEAGQSHWRSVAAVLALGVLALPASAAATGTADDTPLQTPALSGFTAVSGEVTLIRGSSRSAAVRGEDVHEGDVLLTGAAGRVALALQDGTRLALGRLSRLEITQFRYDTSTGDRALLLSLRRGTLAVAAAPDTRADDQLKVVTPTAVVTGQGANFIVEQQTP